MILYPAIDLLDGAVVRLRQGEYGDSTVYGADPLAVAEGFVAAGAAWVHMVDLDAARSGTGRNRALVSRVAAALAGRAQVQVGGGVRTLDDARELRDAGVARVVMGSAAVNDPGLVEKVSHVVPVAVGLDHRAGNVATHGWTESSGRMVLDILGDYPSAAAFVITDISRDGMLTGPDVEGLVAAAAATTVPVIASGGVGTLDHLRDLAAGPGIEGVIVGKAIYENRFTVADAIGVLS
ncbi:MAG: 1-(5-phosphoribosyl)-5-((5-phosphoribosylamino)methylideneamino)imidazole-4-carboxamide isomerase [Actinobacteria bacterium]|nr:1-(5-phosphoribosyl)-5-((5-phosphoribosylamino)methylideneamino)imidazole-4-carboxamide isomerase [Actinomycetota bacterium]NBR67567.1 1-(5-phosphoribosyl)-5-((5-phosphoribosylamino)methylideneamino)imidazole-4-carboxamide isomerase [Actinomycetota bacterium]NBU16574.1 1-(5-phosphoribosyl)-5-((5-phosphoribosylamino)methylideneamino)imidazole-4-carboxamide isomerase [Actinomycetota bacterium]